MRKLIFMMSVSLDGYFEGPDHDLSWHLISDELHQHFNDELRGMSTFIEGRVNYRAHGGLLADRRRRSEGASAGQGVRRHLA